MQLWDVVNGHSLMDPLVGTSGVHEVDFHPSGQQLVAAWDDGAVQVIDIPPQGDVSPNWLPDLAEAVAGRRLLTGGKGTALLSRESIEPMLSELGPVEPDASGPTNAAWSQWILAKAAERTIAPGSRLRFNQYSARVRQSGDEGRLRQLLRFAPNDGLTYARIGVRLLEQLSSQKELTEELRAHSRNTADWYTQHTVQLAHRLYRSVGSAGRGASPTGPRHGGRRGVGVVRRRNAGRLRNVRYLQAVSLAQQQKWAEADREFLAAIALLPTAEAMLAESPQMPLLGPLDLLPPHLTGRSPLPATARSDPRSI